MADLIAQGTDPHHRWRHRLPADQENVVGREGNFWAVPSESTAERGLRSRVSGRVCPGFFACLNVFKVYYSLFYYCLKIILNFLFQNIDVFFIFESLNLYNYI